MTSSRVYLSILRSCSDDLFPRVCETYFKYKLQDSAASRCILVPFERYGHPKNVFPCMFHVKPKWNIVYKYLKNKKFFKIPKYRSQTHWTSNIFVHSATIIGGLGVSLNYPILNLKKTVCPKNVWMRHCRKKVFHKRFSSILYKNKKQLFEG